MPSPSKPLVCIVTPGTREANNGNWRTAHRWARMLDGAFRTMIQTQWDGAPCDAMIALHARKSAASVAGFRERHPVGRLAVVLTGTDLYKDLPDSREAVASLDAADRIVTLQEDAPRLLQARWRRKAEVIFQSCPALPPRARPRGRLDCVAVGHLREEKDPTTLWAAIGRLPASLPIRILHVGAPLDAALGRAAQALAARDPRFRYAGALPRGLVRAALHRSHLLVHPSVVEGGANVIVEAVTARTPVVASRISGNVGMLGEAHPGYFEPRDAAGLAALLERGLREPAFLRALERACAGRLPLFDPRREQRAVQALARRLVSPKG